MPTKNKKYRQVDTYNLVAVLEMDVMDECYELVVVIYSKRLSCLWQIVFSCTFSKIWDVLLLWMHRISVGVIIVPGYYWAPAKSTV